MVTRDDCFGYREPKKEGGKPYCSPLKSTDCNGCVFYKTKMQVIIEDIKYGYERDWND